MAKQVAFSYHQKFKLYSKELEANVNKKLNVAVKTVAYDILKTATNLAWKLTRQKYAHPYATGKYASSFRFSISGKTEAGFTSGSGYGFEGIANIHANTMKTGKYLSFYNIASKQTKNGLFRYAYRVERLGWLYRDAWRVLQITKREIAHKYPFLSKRTSVSDTGE